MKKRNVLKSNNDFNRIIQHNKPYKYKDFIIYLEHNTNDIYKFGISVGKKLGNAVARNKLKRQVRNIIDQKDYQNNFNCIIILSKGIKEKIFKEKEETLLTALKNLNLIKEEKSEK